MAPTLSEFCKTCVIVTFPCARLSQLRMATPPTTATPVSLKRVSGVMAWSSSAPDHVTTFITEPGS